MVKQEYAHYICDYCNNEVVDKNKGETSKWITVSRAGATFGNNEQLMIAYMNKGWDNFAMTGFKSNLIKHNLSFCSKECLLKFILKHLGEIEVIPENLITPEPTKPISRFDDIETLHNKEDK